MIVQGAVTPDHYEVDKKSLTITAKTIKTQEKQMLRKQHENIIESLSQSLGSKQKISDEAILAIAKIGKNLEKHYYFPQDIEWAIDSSSAIYIVQTRPVTTMGKELSAVSSVTSAGRVKKIERKLLVKGDPASPGDTIRSGTNFRKYEGS